MGNVTSDKVLNVALGEEGYLEKRSNAQLDSKTANAGSANYTKYGESMGCNGYAWCDAFVDWCFVQAFGKEKAKELLGGFSNYTPTSAQYFKNMDRWHTSDPKPGDQIFFKNSQRICHTGLVYKVDASKVYTIEGNTSGANGVIANGGGVCRKSYSLNYSRIAGYGRPRYDGISGNINVSKTSGKNQSSYPLVQFVMDVQAATGSKVDGKAGSETIGNTVTVSRSKNNRHAVVTPLERRLKALGYYSGAIEADQGKTPCFGSGMAAAVKTYQKNVLGYKNPDEEVTARKKMWKSLLGMV